ncbi:MAG TPA: M56 family metallopeptidase [Sphingomicrobium sp.]|nr:M56 family metallopeptidase [Sphingomicrobium sp.]
MSVLIAIALKSLIIAGLTLGLLELMKKRSAAERSWVAHIGLLALVIMAFAPLVLPTWKVETPALFTHAPATEVSTPLAPSVSKTAAPSLTGSTVPLVAPAPTAPKISAAAAASAIYAVPAAILLLITALALARLFALRARAEVLVDGHWLSALALAQRRMGFKHGTALLTSNELASPISWGLMRPVILLSTRAVEASSEAEAIIAHELAHVARMDWAKLLLTRIATALFWFNPLVWILAREAHQLREETADDAVLAADIADTDYAELLVGVARHECPGLLLGAHGVAPSKTSLARRVARVLDGKSVRRPAAGGFALGVFVGAVLVAAPLAALTFTPPKGANPIGAANALAAGAPISAYYPGARDVPTDLGHIIASGVTTSVATATAAIVPVSAKAEPEFSAVSPNGSKVVSRNGVTVATSATGASAVIYPPDAHGRSRVIATSPNGNSATVVMNANQVAGLMASRFARSSDKDDAVDSAIELKAMGITPDYIAAMRAASPALRNVSTDDLVQMKAVGVTPQYVRELAGAGFGNLSADDIVEARAVGLTPDYMRAIRATGVHVTMDDLVELRAMNITPEELARVRASGSLSKEQIRELAAPRPPHPPAPPVPPNVPRVDPDSD